MSTHQLQHIQQQIKPLLDEAGAWFGVVVLCQGLMEDNTPFYCYTRVGPADLYTFAQNVANGTPFSLTDVGEMIIAGEGAEPPAKVRDFMAETYNADEELVQKLVDALHGAADERVSA